jgi:hypothetical protein
MDAQALQRLEAKTPQQRMYVELVSEFGFPPVVSNALVRRVDQYVHELNTPLNPPGRVTYLAAGRNEPPGKTLQEMRLVPVQLTLHHAEDPDVLREGGMDALREVKIQRLTEEAADQDAWLTQEDLALLVCTSIRSVRRAVARLRQQGLEIPTRGQKMDIGKGVSHKTRIIDLWLQGHQYSEIQRRTHHTPGCIQTYLVDFSRVAFLHDQALNLDEMRQATGMSQRLIQEYLDLLARCDPKNPRLAEIQQTRKGGARRLHQQKGGEGPPTAPRRSRVSTPSRDRNSRKASARS